MQGWAKIAPTEWSRLMALSSFPELILLFPDADGAVAFLMVIMRSSHQTDDPLRQQTISKRWESGEDCFSSTLLYNTYPSLAFSLFSSLFSLYSHTFFFEICASCRNLLPLPLLPLLEYDIHLPFFLIPRPPQTHKFWPDAF